MSEQSRSRIEIESTDASFLMRLIEYLNTAHCDPFSTVVRLVEIESTSVKRSFTKEYEVSDE